MPEEGLARSSVGYGKSQYRWMYIRGVYVYSRGLMVVSQKHVRHVAGAFDAVARVSVKECNGLRISRQAE